MARSDSGLFWRVLLNAATKPRNILTLGGLAALAIAVGGPLAALLGVGAVTAYGLLVASTVRDPKENEKLARATEARPGSDRSLMGITGGLRQRVLDALAEERGISQELARWDGAPPDGVEAQVSELCDQIIAGARRATDVDLYLASVDIDKLERQARAFDREATLTPSQLQAKAAIDDQLAVVDALGRQRQELEDEMTHVIASLGAVRARLVQARMTGGLATGVGDEVNTLRERMRVLAESLGEAYGQQTSSPTDNTSLIPEKES